MFPPVLKGRKVFYLPTYEPRTVVTLRYRFDETGEWATQSMDKDDFYFITDIAVPSEAKKITYYFELYEEGQTEPIILPELPYLSQNLQVSPQVSPLLMLEHPTPEFQQRFSDLESIMNLIAEIVTKTSINPLHNVAQLRTYLIKYPKAISLWIALGSLEFSMKRNDDAFNSLLQAKQLVDQIPQEKLQSLCIAMKEKYARIWLLLGAMLVEYGNRFQTHEYFNKTLELNPHSSAARDGVGNYFCLIQDYSNALKAYKTIITSDSSFAGAAMAKCGDIAVILGNFEDAKHYYQSIIDNYQKKPNNTKPWTEEEFKLVSPIQGLSSAFILIEAIVGLARIAIKEYQKIKAQKYIEDAKMHDPNSFLINIVEAEYNIQYGSAQNAIILLESAIAIFSGIPNAWLLLGKCYENEDRQKAFTCFYQAMKYGYVFETLAYLKTKKGELLEMLRDLPNSYETFLKTQFSEAEADLLVVFLYRGDQFELANECIKRSSLKNRTKTEFIVLKAGIAMKARDYSRAIDLHNQLIRIYSAHVKQSKYDRELFELYTLRLAQVYLELADFSEVYKLLTPLIQTGTASDDMIYTYARNFFFQNQFEQALVYFKQVTPLSDLNLLDTKHYIEICVKAIEGMKNK